MDANRGSFDKLVSGISAAERQALLEKMQAVTADEESQSLEPVVPVSDASLSLSTQLKKESVLFRIFLWIQAVFSNTSVETIFNEHLVGQTAREVEKKYPGLIDYKHGYLLSPLFDAFSDLKTSANFFRPYIDAMEESQGDFYVLMGSIMLPAVEALIDSDVDPYATPVSTTVRTELRTTNLRRLEGILQDITPDQKAKMYMGARAVMWLLQFVRLPFTRFLTHFNMIINNEHRCAYSQVESELNAFVRVLCNGVPIPDEVLESLYLYSGQLLSESVAGRSTDGEDSAERFMEKAHTMLSAISRFIREVPLAAIARIAANDAQWQAENFAGGEDWFVLYKASWKKLFERKWEDWVQDCKKESLKERLLSHFMLKEFPLLPDRPWAALWGGLHFRYELTAGFLYWYFREIFPQFELVLKTIMLEGDFIQKQNRVEYTESFNNLIEVSIKLDSIQRRLKSGGEIGIIFTRLINDKSRTLQGQAKAEDMLKNLEGDVGGLLYQFGEACRQMDLLLNGILQTEKKDSRYDSLSNLMEIQGSNNAQYRARLVKAHGSLINAYDLVKELEPIDSPAAFR